MLDEWLGDLRAVRGLRRSTLRGYQEAIRMLCLYLTDPAYGWTGECETRFGTHPVQVVHEWNTAVHVQQAEGDPIKRAFTIDELQAFFDHADGEVARIRAAGRKGWLPAFRDATLFKIAYGYGLRRNETRMLDVADFGTNPHAPRVRRARGLLRPPRQGHEGLRPETAQRAHRLAVGRRGPHRVDHPDPAAARRQAAARPARRCGPRSGRRGSGWPRSTPASPPSAPRSGWARAWTSTRCAAPTSRT